MLALPGRSVYGPDHEAFRDTVRAFISREIEPNFLRWEKDGIVDRSVWKKAGEVGILCPQVPETYGGPGVDFKYNAIVGEEFSYAGFAGPLANFSVHSDVCIGYLLHYGNEAQKERWIPGMVRGDIVCAIAMTEPSGGSDLKGIRTTAIAKGNSLFVNGQKTFISSGQHADLVIVVARTNPSAGAKGLSLVLVEATRDGFHRGRNLDKLGHQSADTSELFFDNVEVPLGNLLGGEGCGFAAMMEELPQERLTLAFSSMGAAQRAFDITCRYVRERTAFGKPVAEFQNTRFKLADLRAELAVGWAFVDQCLARHIKGQLTGAEASMAKLWCTEMHGRLVDQCLQFFGGYGFMREFEICRLYSDARVQRIYGGTSEIMRELISRDI